MEVQKMKTYQIIQELKNISVMEEEIDEISGEYLYTEEEISRAYKEINAQKEDKLNAIEDYKRSIKKEQELYEEKKKKQEENIKRCKNKVEYLNELQESLLNGEKLKTDEYTFSFRSSSSVNVYDIEQLEDKYFRIEKKPILKDIGEAIKNANSKGESFFGAEIVNKVSLSIR